MTRDEFARRLREIRKEPYGRRLARLVWLAKRKTERELAATAFGLFPAKSGELTIIVRRDVK